MIVSVCLNAALDVTYHVAQLRPGDSVRVDELRERAGGKGINVARAVHQQGVSGAVCGFAGGATGAAIRADLAACGVQSRLTPIRGDSRRTITVVSPQEATVLLEPGPQIDAQEWAALCEQFRDLLAGAAVAVCAGSLPLGAPGDAYAQLCRMAHTAGVAVLVDASGPALLHAVAAGADVARVNAAEAAETLVRPVDSVTSARAAARCLVESGARAAVVSRGRFPAVAVTPAGDFAVHPPAVPAGNPTGAGDAFAATLAVGLARGSAWPAMLADSAAVACAAVAEPDAGRYDPARASALCHAVRVTELQRCR